MARGRAVGDWLARVASACALTTLLALSLSGVARANTAGQDIGFLNAERAHWGLPSGITENATWSSDCAMHNNYEMLNGGQLAHMEVIGMPSYSEGGQFAAENSVLAAGSSWTGDANPFENAPIHLMLLFTPSLNSTGVDDTNGFVCATTFPGMNRPAPSTATITTYPGNGTIGFPPSEDAEEGPNVPGDFVGVPAGTTAGRELFVYLDVPGESRFTRFTIKSASLVGPGGQTSIKWVDDSISGIATYLTGAIIIPVKPMAAATTYRATVTVNVPGGGTLTRSWSFTTAGAPNTKISKAKIKSGQHKATFRFTADGSFATGFQCALQRRNKKSAPVFKACRSPKTYKHLKRGKYTFLVRAVNGSGVDPTPAKKNFRIR